MLHLLRHRFLAAKVMPKRAPVIGITQMKPCLNYISLLVLAPNHRKLRKMETTLAADLQILAWKKQRITRLRTCIICHSHHLMQFNR